MRAYKGSTVTKKEARRVLLEARGPLPLFCDDCGTLIEKFGNEYGHVHHEDHDPLNNSPENVALLDAACHRRRHNTSELTRSRRSQASIARNAASNLQSEDVFARRQATLRDRYATEPELHTKLSSAIKKLYEDPEYVVRRKAAMQKSWDGNVSRKRAASTRAKKMLSDGTIQKKPCPYGCPLTTFPGPLARHIKAKHN